MGQFERSADSPICDGCGEYTDECACPTPPSAAWEVLLILVSMASEDELEALDSTLDDDSRDDARAALAQARREIEEQIANYQGET